MCNFMLLKLLMLLSSYLLMSYGIYVRGIIKLFPEYSIAATIEDEERNWRSLNSPGISRMFYSNAICWQVAEKAFAKRCQGYSKRLRECSVGKCMRFKQPRMYWNKIMKRRSKFGLYKGRQIRTEESYDGKRTVKKP